MQFASPPPPARHHAYQSPDNFSSFRQSHVLLSPVSEQSESDASNCSTPKRSFHLEETGYNSPSIKSHGDEISDVMSQLLAGSINLGGSSKSSAQQRQKPGLTEVMQPSELFAENNLLRSRSVDSFNNKEVRSSVPQNPRLFGSVQQHQSMLGVYAETSETVPRESPWPGKTLTLPKTTKQNTAGRKLNYTDDQVLACNIIYKRGFCNILCLLLYRSLTIAFMISVIAYGVIIFQQSLCAKEQNINITELSMNLQHRVYGQHIAVSTIPGVLKQYIESAQSSPLVMAFHGWTGIGKNFVSQVIVSQVLAPSTHLVIVSMNYLPGDGDYVHKQQITALLMNGTKECTFNLFIIDELDKASASFSDGLLQAILMLKRNPINDTKSLIILLSNSGGAGINHHVFNHLKSGHTRETVNTKELEAVVLSSLQTYRDPSAKLYTSGLVDTIVPFLPLEAVHVKGCIRDHFRKVYSAHMTNARLHTLYTKVLEQLTFFPPATPLFSKTGCRKVPVKVDMVMAHLED